MRISSFWYWLQRNFPQGGVVLLPCPFPCKVYGVLRLSACVPVEGCLQSVCFCCVLRQLGEATLFLQSVSCLSTMVSEEHCRDCAQGR